MLKGKSFSFDSDKVEQLVKVVTLLPETIKAAVQTKVERIVDVVYTTATARRPKITVEQEKKVYATTGRRYRMHGKTYRVSDPQASFGVPVKTGALKISIKKEVKSMMDKIRGRIFTKNPYAGFLEFGTSNIKPRPFMRQSMIVNKAWIQEYFKRKLTDITPD